MAKLIKQSGSPANDALQHYFDDLVAPTPLLSNAAESPIIDLLPLHDEAPLDQINDKLNQAEQLLAKAMCVDLEHDDLERDDLKRDHVKLATPIEVPVASISPLAPIKSTISSRLVQAPENSINLDKEKSTNADNTLLDFENSGQIRSPAISLKDSLPKQFAVLLCDIANVTVAIPLIELGGIHKLSKLSVIAKQPSWCKGILVKGNEKFTCIDAAKWVAPNKVVSSDPQGDYKFAVQLGKTSYLLCCDNISTTIEISSDDVKWRTDTTSRKWLAGLLKERMCALIDGAKMLQEVLT